MNTPDHAFWTYVAFHRKDWRTKAVAGSIAPDVPFYISSAYFFLAYGVGMEVWIQAFETSWIKPFGSFSHSLVVFVFASVVAFCLGKKSWYPFLYGWILHIFTDILTHVSDAQPVLWPLSEKTFPGFVSYWEARYHGEEFTVINLILQSLFAFSVLLAGNRFLHDAHPAARTVLFGILSLYFAVAGVLFFSYGYASAQILTLHLIAGFLFLLLAVNALYPKVKSPQSP